MNKASPGMRVWFVFVSLIIFIGIALTGFSVVNWFLYVPPVVLLLAAIIGYCPSQNILAGLFKKR